MISLTKSSIFVRFDSIQTVCRFMKSFDRSKLFIFIPLLAGAELTLTAVLGRYNKPLKCDLPTPAKSFSIHLTLEFSLCLIRYLLTKYKTFYNIFSFSRKSSSCNIKSVLLHQIFQAECLFFHYIVSTIFSVFPVNLEVTIKSVLLHQIFYAECLFFHYIVNHVNNKRNIVFKF